MEMSQEGAEGAIIYPDHLFRDHPSLRDPEISTAFLVEDDRFFSDFRFHKKKLLLLRASLKHYGEVLMGMGLQVEYLDNRPKETLSDLFAALRGREIETVRAAEIVDHPLRSSLLEGLKDLSIRIEVDESPGFLTPRSVVEELFGGIDRYSMASFYRHQRRRLDILMEDGRPVRGMWSRDRENRKRLPRDLEVPHLPALVESRHVREAKGYVEENFPDNPGSVEGFKTKSGRIPATLVVGGGRTYSPAPSDQNIFMAEN
jgi:deoxyribodipyrimidine photolyase-related protein